MKSRRKGERYEEKEKGKEMKREREGDMCVCLKPMRIAQTLEPVLSMNYPPSTINIEIITLTLPPYSKDLKEFIFRIK